MTRKPLGQCPVCKADIRAVVVEGMTLRRDRCECPDCGASIYVCRAPGCDNYAKGGELYDDELCPSCVRGVGEAAGGVLMAFVTTAAAIAAATVLKEKE